MEELMQGLMSGGGGIWDMPMVSGMVFPARQAPAQFMDGTTGPKRDGVIELSKPDTIPGDGVKIGYRAYIDSDTKADCVAIHFHGNSEVCGAADDLAPLFHKAGFALISVDYRGYGWSTGSPGLKHLTGDAEAVLDFIHAGGVPGIAAGCRIICWGRSIGALSATHLAAARPSSVCGLVCDSGLMSIASLPMVLQLGSTFLGPQAATTLAALPDPMAASVGETTLLKAQTVSCPALVLHGDTDEIVPFVQGKECYAQLGSSDKTFECFPMAGHNDVLMKHGPAWMAAMTKLLEKAKAFDNTHPSRALVETNGLSAAKFNGQKAIIVGPAPVKEGEPARANVKFEAAELGVKALKLTNLKVLDREPFKDPKRWE